MADDEPRQQTRDFTKEVEEELPGVLAPAKGDRGVLSAVLEEALLFEKKTRLAADAASTKAVAEAILDLILQWNEWGLFIEYVTLLCKRRAQMKQVVQHVVQKGVASLDQCKDKATKVQLIEALREASSGKIFVELERSRLTRMLSDIKYADGEIHEACRVLQEVQVETVGSMEKKEKASFLLHQLRLTLETHDFLRAELVAKKVNRKVLNEDDFQDLKVHFFQLMVTFYLHEAKYLDVSKSYAEIFRTPKVQDDPEAWKDALLHTVVYLLLAPHDPEQHDLLLRFQKEKKTAELPSVEGALRLFTARELMSRPIPQEETWSRLDIFQGLHGERNSADLHKRINQHNVRIIAQNYNRIRSARLSELLRLDEAETERYISDMVSDRILFAKIDRPAGIVTFRSSMKPDSNDMLNAWSANISQLLDVVENTCHLIHKENMMHGLV